MGSRVHPASPIAEPSSEAVLTNFHSDCPRLFSQRHERLEAIFSGSQDRGLVPRQIQSAENLKLLLKANPRNLLVIVEQQDSWSKFLTTQAIFEQILTSKHVFCDYLNFVCAFGSKVNQVDDDNKACDGFARDLEFDDNNPLLSPTAYQFCYNLRYYERNQRKNGYPWSLRQMGVYQKTDIKSGRMTWIVLQPSAQARKDMIAFIERELNGEDSTSHQSYLLMHVQFLKAAGLSWREFLGDLRKDISELSDKSCFSRVGVNYQYDWEVTFRDAQRLQLFRQRLRRSLLVLDSTLAIGEGLQAHYLELKGDLGSRIEAFGKLQAHLAELKIHKRSIEDLLLQTGDISNLLFHILEYRNDESIHRSSEALTGNVAILGRIANDTKKENEYMAKISEQASRDSRAMRVLTFVATLYLPAMFMATIFSSNLISLEPLDSRAGATHIVVSKATWVCALATIILMVITVFSTFLFERKWTTSRSVQRP